MQKESGDACHKNNDWAKAEENTVTNGKARRSAGVYGKQDRDGFIHRSWMKSQGLPDDSFDGRPIIGLCNTWSELTPCNAHLRILAEHVKRGVWQAGGVPLEFPVSSLGETQIKPTAMLFRNLLAMDVEEAIRGYAIDGVVLLGGCDKTTPGQLMGAASVDLPAIVVSSGPMLSGKFRGQTIGSGTDVWRLSEAARAGEISEEAFFSAEAGMSRSAGVCNTMGTASTVGSLCEAMGVALPGNASIPAVDARRQTMAHMAGRTIVDLVEQDKPLSTFLTREAFENAILVHTAVGGSTNAVVHLLALAGRCGVDLSLSDFDDLSREIPLLANLLPSGDYLMEDFDYAGGMPAIMNRIGRWLRLNAPTVGGPTIGEIAANGECFNDDVIRPMDNPVRSSSGTWVLRGNLAPGGAIMKPNAASPELLTHEGPAVVFESIEDFKARIDDPDLDVTAASILVLKQCGPKGYPGMPEVGNMQLPQKLLKAGVRDMVRISDARMSGTAYGTVVLHVSPESHMGGPLALVQNGDIIRLDGPARTLDLLVAENVLAQRKASLSPPPIPPNSERGYAHLHVKHVMQAEHGCDLDFLVGKSGAIVTRESH
jgi:dehydratase ilvD1